VCIRGVFFLLILVDLVEEIGDSFRRIHYVILRSIKHRPSKQMFMSLWIIIIIIF